MHKAQSPAREVTSVPHVIQAQHRLNFEYRVVRGSDCLVGGEGKGARDCILAAIACFAIDVGVAKSEKPRIEGRRIGARKQGLIPHEVAAVIGVGNPGSGGGEEEKESGRCELQCNESRYCKAEFYSAV